LNKLLNPLVVFTIVFLGGCTFSNMHMHPSHLMEADEKITTMGVSTGMNLNSDEWYGSQTGTGIANSRSQISHFRVRKGFEEGLYGGMGLYDGWTTYFAGYQIWQPRWRPSGVPYKMGLLTEVNMSPDPEDEWTSFHGAWGIRVQPTLMTVTNEWKRTYWSLFGHLSLGKINRGDWDWVQNTEGYYDEIYVDQTYTNSAIGLGGGLGLLLDWGRLKIQQEMNLAILSVSVNPQIETEYATTSNHTTTVICSGISLDLNSLFKKQESIPSHLPQFTPEATMPVAPASPQIAFDPNSGRMLSANAPDSVEMVFDPLTGAMIEKPVPSKTSAPAFDPETGLMIESHPSAQPPGDQSLLNQQYKSYLALRPLYLTALNGAPTQAQLVDVRGGGVVVRYSSSLRSQEALLPYATLSSITFEGEKAGWSQAQSNCMKGCGLGAAVLLVSTALDIEGLGVLSIFVTPVGAVIGAIVGYNERVTYLLELSSDPNMTIDQVQDSRRILDLVKYWHDFEHLPTSP